MSEPSTGRRCAGILVPLFSIPSTGSWGLGEIADLPLMARWCRQAGCSLLQLLPVTEMPVGETSPYSSLSAMAIDPQFIALASVPDFEALGGEQALEEGLRRQLAHVRRASSVDYAAVRTLKDTVLRRSFARFQDVELAHETARGRAFRTWTMDERWWLEDYALFRALHAAHGEQAWTEWPEALRERDPEALREAGESLAGDIAYRKYLQWIAAMQWRDARAACGPVRLFGDMPFMVSGNSADVWSRQDEFRLDVSVGAPPDAFSETGQDWKLPLYRWDVLASRDFDWLRERARRYVALYDGYRIDHLVGFYRTYFAPHDGGPPGFSPSGQEEQERLGEQVLEVFRQSGASLIAEDLGVIPDFVRASLERMGLAGYKVFRWERNWHDDGQPFIDPVTYPRQSAATSGTHDTEPLAVWWETAEEDERAAVLAVSSVKAGLAGTDPAALTATATLDARLREAILAALFAAGSDYLILPLGDVFGWRDRVNHPATVGPSNWTWKVRWPVERLATDVEGKSAAATMHDWARRHGRL